MNNHVNIVFIGHVDSGKSTLSSNILYLTGNVNKRLIANSKSDTKKRIEISHIMDTDSDEREKGITIDVGKGHFNTKTKRYTILDCPGHKNYIPNMISGVCQADIGILVISARKGEFESGFDKKGQTKEHALLAKTMGINKLIIVINKMDDDTVMWNKDRYDFIVNKLKIFLRKTCGFKIRKDVIFIPISGLNGINITDNINKKICNWYKNNCLLTQLDTVNTKNNLFNKPFRMPINDKKIDSGVIIEGKIESGTLKIGDELIIMPINKKVKIHSIKLYNGDALDIAYPNENIFINIKDKSIYNEIKKGFVLSSVIDKIPVTNKIKVQIRILDLPKSNPLFVKNMNLQIHIHTLSMMCNVEIIYNISKNKKGDCKEKSIIYTTSNTTINAILSFKNTISIEKYCIFKRLGCFGLRSGHSTIGIGKILKYIPYIS